MKNSSNNQWLLAVACQRGDVDSALELLRLSTVDVNGYIRVNPKETYSFLGLSIHRGHTAILKALLERSEINVNQPDDHGRTPLHHAIQQGSVAMVSLLLEHPAIDVSYADNDRRTPLDLAVLRANTLMIRLLLPHVSEDNIRKSFMLLAKKSTFSTVRILSEIDSSNETEGHLVYSTLVKERMSAIEAFLEYDASRHAMVDFFDEALTSNAISSYQLLQLASRYGALDRLLLDTRVEKSHQIVYEKLWHEGFWNHPKLLCEALSEPLAYGMGGYDQCDLPEFLWSMAENAYHMLGYT